MASTTASAKSSPNTAVPPELKLGDGHLRQQAGIGLAALDDRRGHRFGHQVTNCW